jgi:hypothetical protein
MNTKPAIKKFLIIVLPVFLVVFVVAMLQIRENGENNQPNIDNFEKCVAAGNPVMESYPRQCRHGKQTFTEDTGQIVGGDKDEHGCIGSAGYSWCEPKNKCLRIWEEKCYASLEQEIQYILAGKYDKPVGEVAITITKQTGDYAAGGVKFGPTSSVGGMFLAVRSDNIWEVVYDGNGSIDCKKMRNEYKLPDEILKPNFCD